MTEALPIPTDDMKSPYILAQEAAQKLDETDLGRNPTAAERIAKEEFRHEAWELQSTASDIGQARHGALTALGVGKAICDLPEIKNLSPEQSANVAKGLHAFSTGIEQNVRDLAKVVSENVSITPESAQKFLQSPVGEQMVGNYIGNSVAREFIATSPLASQLAAGAANTAIANFGNTPVSQPELPLPGICEKIDGLHTTISTSVDSVEEGLRRKATELKNISADDIRARAKELEADSAPAQVLPGRPGATNSVLLP